MFEKIKRLFGIKPTFSLAEVKNFASLEKWQPVVIVYSAKSKASMRMILELYRHERRVVHSNVKIAFMDCQFLNDESKGKDYPIVFEYPYIEGKTGLTSDEVVELAGRNENS